jgi:hypothetical protein
VASGLISPILSSPGHGSLIVNIETDYSNSDTTASYPTDSASNPEISQMEATTIDNPKRNTSKFKQQLQLTSLPNISVVQSCGDNFEVTKSHPNLTSSSPDSFQIPVLQVEAASECPDFRTNHARQLRQARHSLTWEPSVTTGLLLSPTCTPFDPRLESHLVTQQDLNFDQELEANLDTAMSDRESEKFQAQMSAVRRSKITNGVLGAAFIILLSFVMSMPTSVRQLWFDLVFSFVKVAMPVFTTIANFGTVQFVVSQYWHSFQTRAHSCCTF